MFFRKNQEKQNIKSDIELVPLKTSSNNYELSIIKSILEENSIAYILHDYESGGYMRIFTGTSLYGTDIMVNENDLEKAKSLIEGVM